jgi:hypothetical protein
MYLAVKHPPPGLKKRVEKATWEVMRPGREVKRVTYQGILFEHFRFVCQDCGMFPAPEAPMIKTPLWRSMYPADGVACVPCIEAHLGRRLRQSDLIPAEKAAMNLGWFRSMAP